MSFASRPLTPLVLLAALSLAPAAAPAGAAETVTATPVAARININTAGVKELMTLDGVGRSLAERIVKYRDANGLFRTPADLRKVEGVGAALWERNRARIVVK